MTDKSAAAVREFAEKWGKGHGGVNEDVRCLLDLTTLISEGYVERAKYDELLQQRDELMEALKWIKENITGWCFLGKADAMLKIEAAIKNTER